jgi:AcrR family transcriptional regulator
MRDLARDLGLSPGNLTYHFATKEDVLLGLAERLSDRNARTHADRLRPGGLDELLGGLREVFLTQVDYRCLILSIVHLSDHYPRMAERYRATQRERIRGFRAMLRHLAAQGSLAPALGPDDLERLVGTISLVGRFWLSEVRLDHRDRAIDAMIDRYLDILAGALRGSATAKGREELRRFRRARSA